MALVWKCRGLSQEYLQVFIFGFDETLGCSRSLHQKKKRKEKKRKLSVAERWGKGGVLKESLQVINTSSRFISGDISLLTIITYFWAIQRGLQYFYGPFL